MKLFFLAVSIIFVCSISTVAQEVNLPKLIEETQTVSRKTAYKAWVEYTSDYKMTSEKPNKTKDSWTYETLCSRKSCVGVLTSKNNIPLSEKKIQKSREKTATYLDKAEKKPDLMMYKETENSLGYGIMIYTWFNPNLYLTACESNFIDKSNVENRNTLKISITNCNLEKISKLVTISNFQFMAKTEGFIWIDEHDKAIVKMELYAKKEFPNLSNTNKPLVTLEASRIPDGYWFWKSIKVIALENKSIFPEYNNNWEYEFYNYKRSNVEIDKAEVDKKPN